MTLQNLICTTLIVALCSCTADHNKQEAEVNKTEELFLCFPNVVLKENERIVGLEVTITHGSVKAINSIPEDWSIHLNTDPQWQPKVTGGPHHGAGALNAFSDLDLLLLIRPWRDKGYDFNVEARVFTTVDFEQTTTRTFQMGELVLKRKSS